MGLCDRLSHPFGIGLVLGNEIDGEIGELFNIAVLAWM